MNHTLEEAGTTASPKHTADEEDSLFPRLRDTHDPAAKRALKLVEQLERDHDTAERHHHAVEALVRRWLADGGLERGETAKLRGHLAALRALYQRHIDVEDRELFPAAARLLSATQIADIGREMAERRSRSRRIDNMSQPARSARRRSVRQCCMWIG